MYESSGSLTDKLIDSVTGNVRHEMGLFDECIAVNTASFQAKYCTVFFDSHQTMTPNKNNDSVLLENMSNFVKSSVAFCIPSSCTADELRSAVAHRLATHRRLSLLSPIASEDFCYTQNRIKDDKTFTTGAIITWYCHQSIKFLLFITTILFDLVASLVC